jgi:hypothetical protein
MKTNKFLLLSAQLFGTIFFFSGCGSMPFTDSSKDIVTPVASENFMPAVAYMPACEYNTKGFLGLPDRNQSVLQSACQQALATLSKMEGLTLKQPVQFTDKLDPSLKGNWSRRVARSPGVWIDKDLEAQKGARYRLVLDTPNIGSDGGNSAYVEFWYTVQRISDGAIMKVQPRGGGETTAAAAATKFATQIKKVLSNPASVPPEWHSPF